jgi:uncharacterized RDD family membrane protein YckC|tara:strand:- start:83 stop:487 length:405 start_codon:yes stop_codon:yes gene_type:complete
MMQNDNVGHPAGFWIRFLAVILDSIPVVVVNVGLVMLSFMMNIPILGFLTLPFALFYYIYFPCSDMMGTPAKALLGLKITDNDGNKISLGTSVLRFLGTFISSLILFIGYIMAGFTENKKSLHDMIAGTRVTYK